MPSLPTENRGSGGISQLELMDNIKRVIDYGNMSYFEALELPCDIFLLMAKKQYIKELQQTEEGQKYLEQCERMKITKIDLTGLKEKYGEGGE